MKIRNVLALLLVIVIMAAVMPLVSIAEKAQLAMMYRKMWNDTDALWAEMEAAETEMEANGASKESILKALFEIAATGEGIVSCEWDDEETFSFVHESGMVNAYSWRVNNSETAVKDPTGSSDYVTTTLESLDIASDLDVVVLGPFYGMDMSFTDQYPNEAASIAEYTGGGYTVYSGREVNADACRAIEDYGVIIFDSHGIHADGRSYLCVKNDEGFTDEDYVENRIARGGAGVTLVTGAFWEYYCPDMKNAMVWMAICESMMTDTLAVPLINAGCSTVYGYSQSVSFYGDYDYEETFWGEMKQGATVADAFSAMVDAHGVHDPYSNPPAYPIVVSELDEHPDNPDAPQIVYSEWQLPTEETLVFVDPVSVEFEFESYGVAPMFEVQIAPVIDPVDANSFEKTWTTSDPSIATVTNRGVVKGVSEGSVDITLTLSSAEDSHSEFELSATATVTVSNVYLPYEVMYVHATGIVPGEEYLVVAQTDSGYYAMTNEYYNPSDERSLMPVPVELTKVHSLTSIVEGVDAGEGWIFSDENGGTIKNAENGQYLTLNGNYLRMGEEGIEWTWSSVEGEEFGILSNDTNVNFKYLGCNNNASYFGAFINSCNVMLFQKLVKEAELPPVGVIGDANGDGTVATDDALIILRHSLGTALLSEDVEAHCDVDGDGDIDSSDALTVLRAALGSIEL